MTSRELTVHYFSQTPGHDAEGSDPHPSLERETGILGSNVADEDRDTTCSQYKTRGQAAGHPSLGSASGARSRRRVRVGWRQGTSFILLSLENDCLNAMERNDVFFSILLIEASQNNYDWRKS